MLDETKYALLLLSDMHLRLRTPEARRDNVQEALEKKLYYIYKWCRDYSERTGHIVIKLCAGDFTDMARDWHVLPWVMEWLTENREDEDEMLFVVRGQHDSYMYNNESKKATIIGVLESAGLISFLGSDPLRLGGACPVNIYGCDYGEDAPKPERGKVNILVIHKMVLSKKVWAYQQEYEYADRFLARNPAYKLILCGDYHYKFYYRLVNRYIVNTGCLFRKTANKQDIAHIPGFFVYVPHLDSLRWHRIPCEPASKVLTREHLDAAESEKKLERVVDKFASALVKSTKTGLGEHKKLKPALIDFIRINKVGNTEKRFLLQALEVGKDATGKAGRKGKGGTSLLSRRKR